MFFEHFKFICQKESLHAYILFHLWKEKTKAKASHGEQIFLEIKVYLVCDFEGFALLFDSALFLLKSSI